MLVARLDNCGDVLLAGPAVRAAAASGRPVHLLCGPRGRAAAELLPGVAGIVEMRAPWIEPDRMPVHGADAADLVARVRALGVTDAAVLVSSHQSPLPLALLLRWAGVGRIAAVSHDHAGSLLDARIPGDPDVHEVTRSLLVTESLGFPSPADDRLRIDLGPTEPGAAAARVGGGAPFVVVHPGASAPARTLAADRWREVVAALAAGPRPVAVTGGGGEAALTAHVAGGRPGVADLGGRLGFRQLAALFAAADAVVTGNTGPMHLAAAVGTPVVAVFPPTVPLVRWRPWRVPHVLLGDQAVPCAGCRSRRCPLEGQPCLEPVSAETVAAALAALAPSPTAEPAA
ncbi:MAG TPA: glycosyltransferase family 9 protein [Acidimicrobiales bacterium]